MLASLVRQFWIWSAVLIAAFILQWLLVPMPAGVG